MENLSARSRLSFLSKKNQFTFPFKIVIIQFVGKPNTSSPYSHRKKNQTIERKIKFINSEVKDKKINK